MVDDYNDIGVDRYGQDEEAVVIMPSKIHDEQHSKTTSLRDSNHRFRNIYGEDAAILSGHQVYSQTQKDATINVLSNQSSHPPQGE